MIVKVTLLKRSGRGLVTDTSIIIKVSPTVTATVLLEHAVKQLTAFDRRVDDQCVYVLLYKDRTEVFKIPGTDGPFTLAGYKEAS